MSLMQKFRETRQKMEENRQRKDKEREEAEAARKAAAQEAWRNSPEGQRAAAREKRQQEAEVLKAKLLNPPPAKMAASIKIWEKDVDETSMANRATSENDINSGFRPFVVDLYLVPSEEEREIITSFKLDELILDDEPRYTPEELHLFENAQRETNEGIARINGRHHTAEMAQQFDDWAAEEMKKRRSARHYTKLQDFFNFPYTRAFATNHEAHTYAVRLREELLPKVRGFVEDYRNRGTEETFTV